MAKMGGSMLLKLTTICLIASTFTNSLGRAMALGDTLSRVGLTGRADTCAGLSGYSQCGSDFPDSFCCSANTKCVGNNAGKGSNSGAICCPSGDCTVIQPVVCETELFNATLHPDNPLHLSWTPRNPLVPCGTGCCPPLYDCKNGNCVLRSVANTTTPAATAPTTAPAQSLSSATGSVTATDSAAAATSSTSSSTAGASAADLAKSCNAFPPNAIIAGFFPGMLAGSLLTFLLIICLGRRNRSRQKVMNDNDSTLGPVRAHISDPIYQNDSGRIDFIRRHTRTKIPPSPDSGLSRASTPPLARVRSLFSKSPSVSREKFDPALGISHTDVPVPPLNMSAHSHPDHAYGGSLSSPRSPSTPTRQLRRESSTGSIPIMSPPEASRDLSPSDEPGDRQTTFGDVLKAVGLQAREPMPYMGSPGMVDPRSRGVDDGRIGRQR